MKKTFISIYRFYVEGFKNMTWGKQLWLLIIIKLIVLFAFMRIVFFKPVLADKTEKEKIEHVFTELSISDER